MVKDGSSTELEVLREIKGAPQPIQTWEIQKRLKFSSGKLQSALRRLEQRNAIVRKKVTRVTKENQEPRVVAFVWDRDFEAKDEVPVEIVEKVIEKEVPGEQPLGFDLVHWFEVLDPVENPANPEEVAIPVKLSKFESLLLAAIPQVNPKYNGITGFLQAAVTDFLKRQSNNVKLKAIQYLVEQGTISREYGDQLLGTKVNQDNAGGELDE